MSAPSTPSRASTTAEEERAAPGSPTWVLLALTLASGMAGLVHELLYLRILGSVLGDLFRVHTALLGVFLVAIGVGALVAHRLVPWLFAVEIALGLHGLAFPAIVRAFQGSFLDRIVDAPGPHAVVAAVLLLAWPAACVGLSVPLFSAYLAPRLRGAAFSWAYVIFNLGAALSLLVVEYAVVPRVGYSSALRLVGAANLAVGTLLFLGRRGFVPAEDEPRAERLPVRLAMAVFLVGGFGGVFSAAFLKLSYALYHPNLENFALCTAALLLALAVGTVAVERTGFGFSRCSILAGATLCGVWLLVPFIGTLYRAVPYATELLGGGFPGVALRTQAGSALIKLGFALVLGGTAYAWLGGTLPALMRGESAAAGRSGQLLFVSGIGNALGLVLFDFVLHPSLPFFWLAALTAAGFLVAALVPGVRLAPLDKCALAVTVLMLPLLASLPESMVYTGFVQSPRATIRVFKSGPDDTTLVLADGGARIHYNGLPEISIGDPSRVNSAEIRVGLIPALLASRRDRALVLGLGSGITAGTVATVCANTDVVDLNRAALPLAESLSYANFEALQNPGLSFYNDDARRYLARRDGKQYDVVVNTVSTPRFHAAAKVYTVEFFDSVKGALAPGGVYATWFSPVDTSPEGTRMLLAGLASRFRHCALASVRGAYYVAACSDEPLRGELSLAAIPQRVATMLARSVGVPVSLDVYLNTLLMTRDAFAGSPFPSNTPLNHDDFPRLEFHLRGIPRTTLQDPVVADATIFNIDTHGDPSSSGFMERAMILYAHHAQFFRRYLEPVILTSPPLREEFRRRLGLQVVRPEESSSQVGESSPAVP